MGSEESSDFGLDNGVHLTKPGDYGLVRVGAFGRLMTILRSGYLIPSFAPRTSQIRGSTNNTIQGDHPAVCFTDQPLWAFLESCRSLSSRYRPYAVAVLKRNLFRYGGRPVIYGDKNQIARLPPEQRCLWVRYEPVPDPLYGNYPIDWTHEREWRSKVEKYGHMYWGTTPDEGVPLVLPPLPPTYPIPLPYILVWSLDEARHMREYLNGLPAYDGANGFVQKLYEHRTALRIVPLSIVADRIATGDRRYGRLDTLPFDDLTERTTTG